MEDGIVRSMAAIRLISSAVELSAALLILRLGRIEHALRINALLGLFGPTVLVTVTLLGVIGLAGKLSLPKISLILTGVILILLGTR